MSTSQTWFITGASQGLGLALAQHLRHLGHRVAATSRRLDSLTAALGPAADDFLPLPVDLTDDAAVRAAVTQAHAHFGRLDVVVNNAGYGIGGSIEELSDAEVRQAFDVNVFGTLNVIRHALPLLRAAGAGHIINVSSIAARAGATGWAVYGATKAAVSALTEVLAQDVAGFGIWATVVEPGGFRTNFLSPDSLVLPRQPVEAYADVRASHVRYLQLHGQQGGDPAKAAAAIVQLAQEANPPVHLLLGQDAYNRAQAKLDALQQELTAWRGLTMSTGFAQ
ncbi:SDR family NAD(P)-dependent oxidoreductase [Hymenobacter sp. 15J16-1T3B]|uniref:SDR family NAD(P)-dependent oxidoreductase n=1 Tax=Hymenobacter sp. 15J16-1T3B TaxID=2886941 RepID=UPI001D124808|nr:SDR family NAD(P)-dependent oxidoreductase [Hymenobacter sp. 15J16-1T3B]MCC3160592.1 SDR family NAD(P)-dependent oxidoreductase [Hymenobacter sp. 15J16-1T3B]